MVDLENISADIRCATMIVFAAVGGLMVVLVGIAFLFGVFG